MNLLFNYFRLKILAKNKKKLNFHASIFAYIDMTHYL